MAAAGGDEAHALERVAEFGVGAPAEGVEVGAEGAGEEDGILRDEGEAGAQLAQLDLGQVDPVQDDPALSRLEEAEEREDQAGFARSRSPDDADALALLDGEGHAFQDRRAVGAVAADDVVELQATFCGPVEHDVSCQARVSCFGGAHQAAGTSKPPWSSSLMLEYSTILSTAFCERWSANGQLHIAISRGQKSRTYHINFCVGVLLNRKHDCQSVLQGER